MAINTLGFLIFVALACVIYFIVPKKIKWLVLLIASYVYYFLASGKLTVFLIITTLSVYLVGLGLNKIDENIAEKCKQLE